MKHLSLIHERPEMWVWNRGCRAGDQKNWGKILALVLLLVQLGKSQAVSS
jgi:hypothetical protein